MGAGPGRSAVSRPGVTVPTETGRLYDRAEMDHAPPQPVRTVWVDVEDLFEYFVVNLRPSGVQRLAFEIMRELVKADAPVRFARRGPGGSLREVAWTEVAGLFARHAGGRQPAAPKANMRRKPPALAWELWRKLPPRQRQRVLRALALQRESLRNVRQLAALIPLRRRPAPAPAPSMAAPVQGGDAYLVLGAPWSVSGFPDHLRALKERYRVSVTLLLYDLIPVRNPGWVTRYAGMLFDAWLRPTLGLCDGLMAISRHTALDVEAYAREQGIPLPGRVAVVPVGTGLPGETEGGGQPLGLPQPGRYVLFVSTVERRKNHVLLFRVWQRLMEDVRTGRREAASVPDLVFAGRIGWMVADLLTQLENTAWLNGRIRMVRDPSDAELRALYAGCLFTVLPSLFEGWGLPLTESLAAGKPCLAAGTTALPEAGGALCRYFDPADTGSAYRAVTALLDTPGSIGAWEAEVRRSFRPTPWAETAAAVLGHVGAPAGP